MMQNLRARAPFRARYVQFIVVTHGTSQGRKFPMYVRPASGQRLMERVELTTTKVLFLVVFSTEDPFTTIPVFCSG